MNDMGWGLEGLGMEATPEWLNRRSADFDAQDALLGANLLTVPGSNPGNVRHWEDLFPKRLDDVLCCIW